MFFVGLVVWRVLFEHGIKKGTVGVGSADELSFMMVGSVDSSDSSCKVNMDEFRSKRFISGEVPHY